MGSPAAATGTDKGVCRPGWGTCACGCFGRVSFLSPKCPCVSNDISEVKNWDIKDSEMYQSSKKANVNFSGPLEGKNDIYDD